MHTCTEDRLETAEDTCYVRAPFRILVPTVLGEFPNRWPKPKVIAIGGFGRSPPLRYSDHHVCVREAWEWDSPRKRLMISDPPSEYFSANND